jgi:hypothetical protein
VIYGREGEGPDLPDLIYPYARYKGDDFEMRGSDVGQDLNTSGKSGTSGSPLRAQDRAILAIDNPDKRSAAAPRGRRSGIDNRLPWELTGSAPHRVKRIGRPYRLCVRAGGSSKKKDPHSVPIAI